MTGLTAKEEEKILPLVLGVSIDSPEFLKRKAEFYANITVDVPLQGAPLQVGVDENGMFIKPTDYLKFKFASIHPWVSKDEAGLNEHGMKQFYIHDPETKLKEQTVKLNLRKDAYKEFILLTAKPEKMAMVVNLLGNDPKGMKPEEMEQFLEGIVTTDSEKFLNVVKDKNLEMKSFLMECVSAEVITRIGSSLLEGDEVLGNSIEEAILKLNDKANSETLARLKARLQQFKK